jgi:FAD/FMN-containing dehydrogenase
MAVVSEDSLERFRQALGGRVVLPGEAGYDEARSVWNGAIDRRPAVIARCTTAHDVVAAVGFGRATGLEVTVRGGGHNFAGSAVCDDGLMIDLSAMNGVRVDPVARRARCGGGATWADLDRATQEYGLAVPGGFISHTGVAGLTLGGGMGWLTRTAGLSCDNLVSAEVVTADGRIVTASAGEHPDLHWALRGGGGNFGVVTELEFAAHPIGPLVHLGLFFWEVARGAEALRYARDAVEGLPEAAGAFIGGLSVPPTPFVPDQHHGAPGFALVVATWATGDDHAAVVASIRAGLPALFDLVTPIPYTALQRMFDQGNPWGVHAYEKALYVRDLTDPVIDVLVDAVPRRASPLSLISMFPLSGAFRRLADDATAFGGSRQGGWVVNVAAISPVPEVLPADRAWVREVWDALRPHALGSGSYVNFIADPDEDRVRASYGPEKYARLARIKAEWDPGNLFHHNPNIRPAPGRA